MPQLLPNPFNLIEVSLFSEVLGRSINLDVASTIIEISIFENMFAESISGNIVLLDRFNLVVNSPIVGNEKLTLTFMDANGEELTLNFKLYSLNSYSIENLASNSYTLNFTSEEYFSSANFTISRAYKNLTISEIVSRVFRELETDKKIEIEETDYLQDLIIPSWNPFKALNWLAARAISAKYEGASFLFFENFDGYKFKTIESYMDEKPSRIYKNVTVPYTEITDDYYPIRHLSVKDTFNIMVNQMSGMYSSRVITHDIVKRKSEIMDFDYEESFKKYKHLGKGTLSPKVVDNSLDYTDRPDGIINIIPKHFKLFSNEAQGYNSQKEKTLQIRKSQFAQLNNLKIDIVIDGDLKLRTGQILNILTPDPQASDEWDPYLSGNYLITAIRHIFSAKVHTTQLQLQRDSYTDKIGE